MYLLRFILLSLSVGLQLQLLAREFDTTKLKDAVQLPIYKSMIDPQKGAYVIAGKNAERLLFVNMRYKTKDLGKKKRIPLNTQFSDFLCIGKSILLISTQHNGLYYIRNGAAVHINESYGLTDTNIVALHFDEKHHRVFVKSANAYFVSADYDYRRYIRMTEADKLQMLDSGAQNVKEYFDHYLRQPVQQQISSTVAKVDYSFRPIKAIKRRQFKIIRKSLQPGDILIKRNESELTNIGIPGFWTHTGIYLGNKREFNRFFAGLPIFKGEKPVAWLKKNYPKIFSKVRRQRCAVIEAVGEGVVVSPLEHIALVDHFAALRLNRSPEDIFKILLQSFEYYGLPYDYLFNFETDRALVCSELVYKSITKSQLNNPVSIEQSSLFGKAFVTPSDFALQYCNQINLPNATFQLVIFYKAKANFMKAELKNSDEFCKLKLE